MFSSSVYGIFFGVSIIFSFLIFFGLLRAFFFRKQLLMSLLRLEFIVLGMFIGVIFLLGWSGKPFSVAFYLLVLGACEASLGLSLMVRMVRFSGGDMLSFLSLIKC